MKVILEMGNEHNIMYLRFSPLTMYMYIHHGDEI